MRTESKTTIRGTDVEGESTIGDYKEVGGLMFPHAIEQGQKGSPQKGKITIAKIELNVPVEAAAFQMPVMK